MKVCAIIIWYNPNKNMWKNIERYLPFVNKCIIVDNSTNENSTLIKSKNKKTIYIPNKDNLGIAKALNLGCERAKKLGFDWVLTMDQDSYFEEKEIKKYFKEAEKIYMQNKKAVSFTINYNTKFQNKIKKTKVIITSGNLLNLKAWEKAGKFNEEFFIYLVDTLFSYEVTKQGFTQYKFYNIFMKHNVFDENTTLSLFGKKIYVRKKDSPFMKYYIVRNTLETNRIFPQYKNKFFLIRLIIKIIFFEYRKIEKLKMIWRGYRDYKSRRFGRLDVKNIS